MVSTLIAIALVAPVHGSDDDRAVATVNGRTIEPWEVERELASSIARGSFHQRVPEERLAELECEAIRLVVVKELKLEWARRNGVAVDPATVAGAWQEVRDRFDSDEQYHEALAMKGISETGFRRAFERDAAAAAVDETVLAQVVPPGDDAVEIYFELHREEFTGPETRHVVHVLIHVPPSGGPEAWSDGERRAAELFDRVTRDGADLLVAAAPLLDDVPPRYRDQVGDLGFVHQGSLLPVIDAAVFGAPPGSVIEPIRSIYGWHVLQVLEVRPPVPLELDDVRDAVAANLVRRDRKRRLEEFERELGRTAQIEGSECAGPP